MSNPFHNNDGILKNYAIGCDDDEDFDSHIDAKNEWLTSKLAEGRSTRASRAIAREVAFEAAYDALWALNDKIYLSLAAQADLLGDAKWQSKPFRLKKKRGLILDARRDAMRLTRTPEIVALAGLHRKV